MYHPTSRVLAVLALLQTHGRMTGAELAGRLEVNIRTVRDYITMLQDLGLPIIAERGRYGAYELGPHFKLPPMMFTNDEVLALAIGLLAARRLGLAEIIPAAESACAKLEHVMPPRLKSQMQAVTEAVTLDVSTPPADSRGEVMVTLSRASQLQRRVHMRYRSRQNVESERDLDPYGLACRQGNWYVVGRCGLRNGLRSFRLDRVIQVDLTPTPFERPEHFDAMSHIAQAVATLPRRITFEVLLKTDLVTAQDEIFDMLGLLEPREDGVLLRGSADSIHWVARQLAKFSFAFAVQEPPELRTALRERAAELVNLASSS